MNTMKRNPHDETAIIENNDKGKPCPKNEKQIP